MTVRAEQKGQSPRPFDNSHLTLRYKLLLEIKTSTVEKVTFESQKRTRSQGNGGGEACGMELAPCGWWKKQIPGENALKPRL